MKKILLFIFLFSFAFLQSCKKEKEEDILPETPAIQGSKVGTPSNAGWNSPTNDQLNYVWNGMMSTIEYTDAVNFIYNNGIFNWNEARVVKQKDQNNYLVSIPTMIENKVISVLFASVFDNTVTYIHIHLSDIQKPTDEVIGILGIETTMLAITTFAAHEQHFGDYTSLSVARHLNSEQIRNAMSSVTPRGWCLIEVEIYSPPLSDETGTSNTTGWHTNGTQWASSSGAIIHGAQAAGYLEVFQF